MDVRSRTFAVVTKIFGALDEWQHMHVILVNDNRLEVALPRLDLRFFLNANGDMECYELRKIVDPINRWAPHWPPKPFDLMWL